MTGDAIRGARFRELLALALTAEGIAVEPRPRPVGSISQRLAAATTLGPVSDFTGDAAGRFLLHARVDQSQRWSSALDAAESSADLAGKSQFGALIQYRRDRPAREQFVLMSVATLARIMKALDQ
jgi:hypothetical protein